QADELAWLIRRAFFRDSQCISMRHVLIELAEQAGLDRERFVADFDAGVAKQLVIDEAREGWEQLRVPGSPTFVLPDGQQQAGFGLPEIELDVEQYHRPVRMTPAECTGAACL